MIGKKFKVSTIGHLDTEITIYSDWDSLAAKAFIRYYDLPPNTEVQVVDTIVTTVFKSVLAISSTDVEPKLHAAKVEE